MGRNNKHNPGENITDIVNCGKWKVGRCIKCKKYGIRSNKWINHMHQDWEQKNGAINNQQTIDELMIIIKKKLLQIGLPYLNLQFPRGINSQEKINYFTRIQLVLIDSLTSNPRKNQLMSPMREILQESSIQESMRYPDDQNYNESSLNEQNKFQQLIFNQNDNDYIKKLEAQAIFKQKNKSDKQKQANMKCLENILLQGSYWVTSNARQLKGALQSYQQFILTSNELIKKFKKIRKGDISLYNLLKKCLVCDISFLGNTAEYRQCHLCHTRYHLYCIYKIQMCVCRTSKLKKKNQAHEFVNQTKEPKRLKNIQILSTQDPKIKKMTPKTKKKRIQQQQAKIRKLLHMRNEYHYVRTALCPVQYECEADAILDPFLKIASGQIVQIYHQYACSNYKSPIKLLEIGQNQFGIQAMENIPIYTFICEYACDILPMRCGQYFWDNNSVMVYANGSDCKNQYILVPHSCSNWAPLINHADNGNCSSLRLVINQKIRVIIYSIQSIKKGQQLLYNYNGMLREYNTEGFQEYNRINE